jgi:hypothetical protein
VFILKVVKVLCFDTLSQVFILNGLLAWRFATLDLYPKNLDRETVTARQSLERVRKVPMAESMEAHRAQVERLGGADFARSLRRTGWGANFMSYDSTKWACCQEKYIVGELLVRTDWQVVGGARVKEDKYALGLKRTVYRRGHPNYFQNLVPLLVTPTDRLSSCVRGAALVCKRERTWLAIAGVRRLLPFRSNETDKPRHELRSRFPRRVAILRAISDTRYRPL